MGERADSNVSARNTTGSKWLLPVSEFLGFPLDQVGVSAHKSIKRHFPSYVVFIKNNVLCRNVRETCSYSTKVIDAHIVAEITGFWCLDFSTKWHQKLTCKVY